MTTKSASWSMDLDCPFLALILLLVRSLAELTEVASPAKPISSRSASGLNQCMEEVSKAQSWGECHGSAHPGCGGRETADTLSTGQQTIRSG